MNLDHLDFKPKSASIIDIYIQSMAVIVSCYNRWPLGDDVSTEVEAASSCIKLPKIPEL